MKKIYICCVCFFWMALFTSTVLAGDYLLPDTGQTQSYTNTFGEDSDYLINSPSYTKLDGLGNPLPDAAASWIMVRDENTGLIWEVKTTDGSIHDESNTYTWNDAQSVFIADLNANNFGGYSDWRLPNPKELLSIVDYSVSVPAINTQYFPNTHDSPAPADWSHYWTSTTASFNNGRAWHVVFDGGFSHDNTKTQTFWVRAVRGNELSSTFMDNGDGTITDLAVGLMWEEKTDDGGANDRDNIYTWEEALNWVASLNQSKYLGYDDWRLPNVKELQSIVDYSTTPAIDLNFFPNTQSDAYWSSSTLEGDASYAWVVGFDFGYVDYSWYTTGKLDTAYVRAVRTLEAPTINWEPASIELVLTPGTDNWESVEVWHPNVMYDNGIYKMWYAGTTGRNGAGERGIGYATSADGINWVNRQLVHGPTSGFSQVDSPNVIREGNVYKMWLRDYYETVGGQWSGYVSYMTSNDGINWVNKQQVMSAQGQVTPQGDGYNITGLCVLAEGGGYTMWYAVDDLPPAQYKTWRATSNDGISWGNRALSLTYVTGTWGAYDPNVVITDSGGYIIYYTTGYPGMSGSNLAMATSQDGTTWHDRRLLGVEGHSPFYFEDKDGTPYIYFSRGGSIYRMRGTRTSGSVVYAGSGGGGGG